MRSTTSVSTTGGSSRWITVDSMQPPFSVGLGVSVAYGSTSPVYVVQHTFDPTDDGTRQVSIACTASTTVTVTDTAHGLSTGDSVTITGATNGINGTFDVTVTNANTYTYTTTTSTYNGVANCSSNRVYPHATINTTTTASGTITRIDGNYAFPIYACRIKLASGSGTVSLTVMQGTGV